MKNPHKALQAIEYLSGDDFAMDLEWILAFPKSRKESEKRKMFKEAAKRLMQIYTIAHSEGNCYHDNWSKVKDEIITKYKDY